MDAINQNNRSKNIWVAAEEYHQKRNKMELELNVFLVAFAFRQSLILFAILLAIAASYSMIVWDWSVFSLSNTFVVFVAVMLLGPIIAWRKIHSPKKL